MGVQEETTVVLFYRYACLGDERAAALAASQRRLGTELGLSGRVLVAPEGINGTVQGSAESVAAYETTVQASFEEGIDWKRSKSGGELLFPDFVVKEVAELVGFGIRGCKPLDVSREGGQHLSPLDFEKKLEATPAEELRVIDVRNSFEFEVGHFDGAIDPGMHHTAQWPRFVERNLEDLRGRQVMLYCTGGIRCEKASAYLCRRLAETSRAEAPPTAVHQLEGGIHRYLEAFPDGGRFKGANFVFDRRAQTRPDEAPTAAVGRCSECALPWDRHHGGRLCCVCRALVLVCDGCDAASGHGEYYCSDHADMRGVYYHFVDRFGAEELAAQSAALRERLAAEVGRSKNKRATLRKKAEQVEARLAQLLADGYEESPPPRRCRACGRPYSECPGECWGFWRKEPLAQQPLFRPSEQLLPTLGASAGA